MKLTTYRYAGPPSCASLRVGKTGERLEVLLHPGQPVSMPADHEYTRVLLALKHLHPQPVNPLPTGLPVKAAQTLSAAKE
ncbi:hypothetical protein SAMN03159443_01906 [Pseudomonas sp. NFACC15-1]|uniref:hypothetical protein n=1 Tax=unclassified Pseudomonas TaxID=196821 RepID=UPI00088FCFA4|nr:MULTISPECIES: hypothetical protein [unclassified Pseudomonas]SDA63411.1 hypothetical protein SAMN03159443_01906 [Pseudomonas sp. NFACC15-1]SDX92153.1 hypothetical protein SAMN03159380_03105 [Pseudomonas sp. NFACC14]